MAKYPGARWMPLDRYKAGQRLAVPMSRYDAVVGHTVGGADWSLQEAFNFFNVSGRAAPHLYFDKEGNCDQYIDTDFRATATLNGNHRVLCWEAWDGVPIPPYTSGQIEAMAEFCAWAHKVHGIPLAVMPNSRPESKGIGWHRLGIDGNFPDGRYAGRVSGGETWSLSGGKTCPTDARIDNMIDNILPRARQILKGDEMSWNEKLKLWVPGDRNPDDVMRAGRQLSQARGFSAASYRLLLAMSDADAFAATVARKVAKSPASLNERQVKRAVKEALEELAAEEDDV